MLRRWLQGGGNRQAARPKKLGVVGAPRDRAFPHPTTFLKKKLSRATEEM
jgi:hypothetical protein